MQRELPKLTWEEIRVLGALIEKSKTTPDHYPLSVNSLTAACNQKTSRFPVVNYSEQKVTEVIANLKAMSLVTTDIGAGNRTLKYKHNFNTVFDISVQELAVLCLLMLRGAQTPGEINTNLGRMLEFKSLEIVLSALDNLRSSDPPFVKELPKQAGQKEARYIHLLNEEQAVEVQEERLTKLPENIADLEERIVNLEQELASLKEQISNLGSNNS